MRKAHKLLKCKLVKKNWKYKPINKCKYYTNINTYYNVYTKAGDGGMNTSCEVARFILACLRQVQTRFQKCWDTVQIVNKKGMQ